MKTVQSQRSVEMENVVNHAWAKPLVGMSQAGILEIIILPECCLFYLSYVPLIAHSLNYKTRKHRYLHF